VKCVIRVEDEVWATVSGLDPDTHAKCYNAMSFHPDGYFFMAKYKLGVWDGYVHLFSKTGKIYQRLLHLILPIITHAYEVELVDNRKVIQAPTLRVSESWFHDQSPIKPTLRPYQVDIVNKALDAGSGFVIAATGSGKTMMLAALCDAYGKSKFRTMTVVPNTDLVDQTVNTFILCGLDVGTYCGDKKDYDHQHVIGTWQALQNNPRILSNFEVINIDEAHGAKSNVISELLTTHAPHVAFRYGFTGTLPKPELDQLNLKGVIGEEICSITAAELIAAGYLSNLEIQPIEIKEIAPQEFPDYSSEKAFINRNDERLDFLANLIVAEAEKYGNTLVLVNSIKQGIALSSRIKDCIFLRGETETEIRAEWYALFQERNDLIVIATVGIASTGISIDRIFHLCMVDMGKSFTKVIQSVGRSLRKSGDKNFAHVTDVYSGLKWAKKHAKERVKHYTEAEYPILSVIKIKLG